MTCPQGNDRPRSSFAPVATAVAALFTSGCDAGKTKVIGADFPNCALAPTAPPASLGAPAFYGKHVDASGIPVMSSLAVADAALAGACRVVENMLSVRADVRRAMIDQQMRVVVMARAEVTTDVPEYSDLYVTNAGWDWDAFRGIGATIDLPVTGVGEENMLCSPNVPYAGGNILVRMFATSIYVGLDAADSTFETRLRAALDDAVYTGKWQNTFALDGTIDYFAEGVEDWFESNTEASPPDGQFNEVNTRAELRAYDPALAAIVAESMPDDRWRPKCP
jgi:hypothetical protein